ncbi:HepT-like ribonuclease domain-containing protein [Catalinimonas niigatensis]|uniref:HepT-like ribonuclease domain-containing protein n=1 Tax=Catalinimonas niigatensis TaxID=1397264 RepID=UPI0026669026|nr:HepT-like ribonuclease domain-containing protein [Catalinimonas niigatensis]WPP52705.1 HepT-like ribonuclease domain-containing protein [Catalinimonas niigatensis]
MIFLEMIQRPDLLLSKQLEIIGEAAYHLTKEKYSEVQWQPIIALRHILVHEYYGI